MVNDMQTRELLNKVSKIEQAKFLKSQYEVIKKEAHDLMERQPKDLLSFRDNESGETFSESNNERLWAILKMIKIVDVDILEFSKCHNTKEVKKLKNMFADEVSETPSVCDQHAHCLVNNYYDCAIKLIDLKKEDLPANPQTSVMGDAFRAAFSKR